MRMKRSPLPAVRTRPRPTVFLLSCSPRCHGKLGTLANGRGRVVGTRSWRRRRSSCCSVGPLRRPETPSWRLLHQCVLHLVVLTWARKHFLRNHHQTWGGRIFRPTAEAGFDLVCARARLAFCKFSLFAQVQTPRRQGVACATTAANATPIVGVSSGARDFLFIRTISDRVSKCVVSLLPETGRCVCTNSHVSTWAWAISAIFRVLSALERPLGAFSDVRANV